MLLKSEQCPNTVYKFRTGGPGLDDRLSVNASAVRPLRTGQQFRDRNQRRPMKLTWYGHSAFLIEAGAAKILIDPFCR